MARDIWKDNIKLMLNGCHDCWSYKAIQYAFEANLTHFDPDNNVFSIQTFNEVCSISFNEDNIMEYINTLYEKRYISFVGACPKTAPSQGYTICKHVNWIGMQGRIGDKTTIVNFYTCFFVKLNFITSRDSDWELGN